MPFAKLLTVEKGDSFSIEAHYEDVAQLPFPDKYIGMGGGVVNLFLTSVKWIAVV